MDKYGPTEHLCRTGKWKKGHTCKVEADFLESKRNGESINVNLWRLKKENAEGYTQNELERETIEAAKRDGREIQRPR